MDWHDGKTQKIDKNEKGLENWANNTVEWRNVGADIVGGCCRILPSHIAKMKEVHDKIDPDYFEVE